MTPVFRQLSDRQSVARIEMEKHMDEIRPLTSLSQDELIARIEQDAGVIWLRDAEIVDLNAAIEALRAERDAMKDALTVFAESCNHTKEGIEYMAAALIHTHAPQPAEHNIDYEKLYEQMCNRCDSLDAKLAEYERRGEPVAFLCRECDEEGWSNYVVMPHEVPSTGEFLHVEPLYTAPLPPAPQPAEPCPDCTAKPADTGAMSLDDAIAHAVAIAADGSTPCRRQHLQLAAWLRELREFRRVSTQEGA